jgi:hypothetical protein
MRLVSVVVLALSLSVTLSVTAGCSRESGDADRRAPAPAASERAPAPAAGHAATGVKPGSHEDWCGEHEVPESQCTRCNPDLIAAFKATGDWCAEHGLPESQCLACNPDLKIVRPPPGNTP